MTSSNRDIFRVTGHLCGEFTGHRCIPRKRQWRGDLMLSLIWINGWVNNREAGDLRCHRAHYDVIVMVCLVLLSSYYFVLLFVFVVLFLSSISWGFVYLHIFFEITAGDYRSSCEAIRKGNKQQTKHNKAQIMYISLGFRYTTKVDQIITHRVSDVWKPLVCKTGYIISMFFAFFYAKYVW